MVGTKARPRLGSLEQAPWLERRMIHRLTTVDVSSQVGSPRILFRTSGIGYTPASSHHISHDDFYT